MDNTWIKLYRKLDNNDLIKDTRALQVFIFLLINVDRQTGEYSTGRNLLAAQLGMRPATAYSSLMRLQRKYKMLNIKSNNRFSTISLLNWAKYQEKEESSTQADNNTSSATNQPLITNQEVKNKDIQENINIFGKSPENKEEKNGIYTPWQDKAFRYAEKLHIELDKNLKGRWLKVFKQASEGRNTANLEKAYSYLVDYKTKPLTSMQKALYFFDIYENGLRPTANNLYE